MAETTSNHSEKRVGWTSSATQNLPELETLLFSQVVGRPDQKWAQDYVLWWIRNPDPGSQFEAVSKALSEVDDETVARTVISHGYDGLLWVHAHEVIGHCFFQIHGDALHIFSYFVKPERRGRWSAATYISFYDYARARGDLLWARLGIKRADGGSRILTYLEHRYGKVGVEYRGNGWVCLFPEKTSALGPSAETHSANRPGA